MTIHSIIALVSSQGWNLHQMDVKIAFLHDSIKEEVYVEQPKGFENYDRKYHVLESVWSALCQGSKLFMHFILGVPLHPLSCIPLWACHSLTEKVTIVIFPSCLVPAGSSLLSVITKVHDSQGLVLYMTKVIFYVWVKEFINLGLETCLVKRCKPKGGPYTTMVQRASSSSGKTSTLLQNSALKKIQTRSFMTKISKNAQVDFSDAVMVSMAKCPVT